MSSRNNRKKKTKYLVVSAMLSALGVVIMMLGSVIEVLDLSTAVIASLLCIWAVIEIGGAYPWLIWSVTSVLSFLLLPQKTPVVFYALFAGYYPMLKEKLERKFAPVIALPIKLVIFHAALLLMYSALRLFIPSALDDLVGLWITVGVYLLSIVAFLVYDYALTKLISGYVFRWRKYFKMK